MWNVSARNGPRMASPRGHALRWCLDLPLLRQAIYLGEPMKKTLTAALVVAALSLTTACGGGGDRPSKDEVKSALTSKDNVFGAKIPAKTADCIADALVDSDVSDKTLKAIVDGDKKYKGSDDDKDALNGLQSDLTKCVSASSK